MADERARVGLAQTGERRANVREALERVRDDVLPRLADPVLIKPNFLSSDNRLACTHVDAVRGVLDFLAALPAPPAEVIVAEGGNEKHSGEAFANFGYTTLPGEYLFPIRLVDLHAETRWQTAPIVLADGTPYQVHIPRTVLEVGCTISVAVAKTHDVCVTTLAYKNMVMGTLRREDRVKMHGFPTHGERRLPREAQCLNANLIRVARFLTPRIAVIDGTVGLQGNGPGGKDAVPLGIAVASADVFAADTVMTRAMGFDPRELGLLHYAAALGLGVVELERIAVIGPPVESVAQVFKPHEKVELQRQWHDAISPADLLAA
jgi:uncharacterized protein (DUF362 family)